MPFCKSYSIKSKLQLHELLFYIAVSVGVELLFLSVRCAMNYLPISLLTLLFLLAVVTNNATDIFIYPPLLDHCRQWQHPQMLGVWRSEWRWGKGDSDLDKNEMGPN